MKCESCQQPIKTDLGAYGELRHPICYDCHMDNKKYCDICEEWTAYNLTGSHIESGYCIVCYDIWRKENGKIVDDIQSSEDSMNRQYLQAKLFDMSKGVNDE